MIARVSFGVEGVRANLIYAVRRVKARIPSGR